MKWRFSFWCQRIYHFILYFVATILILAAIIFTLTRSLTPLLNSHRVLFEELTTHLVHNPVTIGRVRLGWRGVQPEILLKNVTIYREENHVEFLHVQRFYLAVDLLHSLWHRKFLPSVITVDGVKLSVQQINNKTYLLNDVTVQSQDQATNIDLQKLQDWFLGQNTVSLQNISIDFFDKNKAFYPINIQMLTLTNNGLKHKLAGTINLRNTTSSLNLMLNAKGDLKDIEHLRISFYGSARNVNLQKWLASNTYYGYRLISGFGQIEAWLNWDHAHWQNQIVKLKLLSLGLQSLQNHQITVLKSLNGDFSWQPLTAQNGWKMMGNHLQIITPTAIWPEIHFAVQQNNLTKQSAALSATINYINLGDVRYLLQGSNFFTPQLQQVLQGTALSGSLQNASYSGLLQAGHLARYSLQGKLTDLSVKSWQNIPGVDHVNAVVQADQQHGFLQLMGNATALTMPELFLHPILFKQVAAKISWLHLTDNKWQVDVHPFTCSNADLTLDAKSKIIFNPANWLPYVDVQAKAILNDPAKLAFYLPTHGIGVHAQAWLDQAFLSGKPVTASMVLKGDLAKFPFTHEPDSTFQVDALIQDLDLRYSAEWPVLQHLQGSLHFSDNKMVADITSGTTLTATIQSAQVVIPEINKQIPVQVLVSAKAADNLQHLIDFLRATPLKDSVGKSLQQFKLLGPGQLDLKLIIPLTDVKATQVNGTIHLTQNAFYLRDNPLGLTNVTGDFNFTANSIDSEHLSGIFLAKPININIKTIHPASTDASAVFQFSTQADIAELKRQFLPAEVSLPIVGSSMMSGELVVNLNPENTSQDILRLSSDLSGVAINYPEPLLKTANEIMPLNITLHFNQSKPLELFFNLGNHLHSAWIFTHHQEHQFNLYAAAININNQLATLPKSQGVVINGNLTNFNWENWRPFLFINKHVKNNEHNKLVDQLMSLPFVATMHIDSLKLGDWSFQPADIKLERVNKSWVSSIVTKPIEGVITIPDDYPQKPLAAHFAHIYLDSTSASNHASTLDPKNIASFVATIDNLRYNDKDVGEVNVSITNIEQGILINKLQIREPLLNADLQGSWENKGAATQTSLTGNITSPNLQGLFNMWDFNSSLIAGHSTANIDFQWADSPFNFDLKKLTGDANVKLENGWIIDLDEATNKKLNMGRLLTLLSIRHFMFHINDLSRQGYSFDSLMAHLYFADGIVTTDDLATKGVVADIKAEGSVNLIKKLVDIRLGLVVNATSSLPVIATIASGFNPIVGVATWLADKAIHNAMSSVNHYKYSIQGPWSNPDVINLNEQQSQQQTNDDDARS